MKNRRNYYRVLHVQPDAPAAIIKASYRILMQTLKAHPDLGGDIAKAQLLNEAYQIISNPEKRAHYDNNLNLRPRVRVTERLTCSSEKLQTIKQTQHKEKSQKINRTKSQSITPEKTLPPMSRRASLRCKFCNTSQSNLSTQAAYSIVIHAPLQCAHCNSPLNNLAQLDLNSSCKRAISRIEREGTIEFFTQWPQDKAHCGVITDISPNGLGFKSTTRLKFNSILKVNSPLLNAVIKIVNHRQISIKATLYYKFGAEFLSVEFCAQKGNFFSQHV